MSNFKVIVFYAKNKDIDFFIMDSKYQFLQDHCSTFVKIGYRNRCIMTVH